MLYIARFVPLLMLLLLLLLCPTTVSSANIVECYCTVMFTGLLCVLLVVTDECLCIHHISL